MAPIDPEPPVATDLPHRQRDLWTPLAIDRAFFAALVALAVVMASRVRGADVNDTWLALLVAVPAALLAWRWRGRAWRRQLRLRIGEGALEQQWPVRRSVPYGAITGVVVDRHRGSWMLILDFVDERGRPVHDALLYLSRATAAELAAGIEARRAAVEPAAPVAG